MNFTTLGIREEIIRALTDLGFSTPTPIQEQSIPALLEKKTDYIGLAQTGTGKTAAFGIPLITHIDVKKRYPQAIVLCPTRELCLQITKELKNYAKNLSGLEIAAIYGGTSIITQIQALKRGVHLVVGTPGRVIDLINRRVLLLNNIETVVLDEADEMLNMGFQEDIDTILAGTPASRNTWLFSATMPVEVERISNNYMKTPVRVTVGSKNSSARNITHHFSLVRKEHQYEAVKRFIDFNPAIFGMVFCRTKRDTQELATKLSRDGYHAEALHGDLSQAQRDAIMAKFRNRQIQLLVATDVAARGIDVNDVTHVIHYNIPEDIEVYTHRSGRTARAGKSGMSLAVIVGNKDLRKLRLIERRIGQPITQLAIPSGAEVFNKKLEHIVQTIRNASIGNETVVKTLLEKLSDLSPQEIMNKILALYVADLNPQSGSLQDINSRASEHNSNTSYRSESPDKQQRHSYDDNLFTVQLTIGRQQQLEKGQLIKFICTNAHISGNSIGRINIQQNVTFVGLSDENVANKIVSSIKNIMLGNQSVTASVATNAPARSGEQRHSSRFSGSRRFGSRNHRTSNDSNSGRPARRWQRS